MLAIIWHEGRMRNLFTILTMAMKAVQTGRNRLEEVGVIAKVLGRRGQSLAHRRIECLNILKGVMFMRLV